MLRLGQARLIEAVAAVLIIIILFSMLPLLFKSPLTPLRSQIQVGVSQYAYNSLYTLVTNPLFINALSKGNWSTIHSLASAIIGPQYNWFIGLEPLYKALTISSYSVMPNYVALNITLVPSPSTYGGYALIDLPILLINQGLPLSYRINTSVPMANVFILNSNGNPVNWWLMSYNYVTGDALIWVKTSSSRLTIIVSRNGSVPYNPITGEYCSNPYCPPYGGLSSFMATSLNLPIANYNNGLSVLSQLNGLNQYWWFNQSTALCSGAYSLSGNVLTFNVPQSSSASCTLLNPSIIGTYTTLIGQLMSIIPGSSLSINLNYVVTVYNGTRSYTAKVPVALILTYYGNGTVNYELYVNGQLAYDNNGPYVYLFMISLQPSVTPGVCSSGSSLYYTLNESVSMYDYVSMTSKSISGTYQSPCLPLTYNGVASASVAISSSSGITLGLNSSYTPGVNYEYNSVVKIYDLVATPPATSAVVAGAYFNYAITSNVIPQYYAYSIPGLPFTPTAGAFTVIVLPNGTYYLIALEIQEVSGG
ncbi:hypothetical protein [Caldivirga maquilingensis]|uniref:DUF2341 domain-containing protein n=1 Tax=Caldivirga maquilingensis (strain ATCC 700844 / DSM 13496 / JCM 10307 / IC-167) TaxID=397948 RepID=A8MBG0_CALMQ|nr:hypothetical protein [Caldivirga maquilingensis]ABW02693.1 hypothetical protein Cmaq_1876 [Caldivirga maquilingensis IC-167]